jgi:hypothetical protein
MKLTRRLLLSMLVWLSLFALLPLHAMKAASAGDFWDEPGGRLLNQPLSEYHARRQKLMSQVKDGVVVILGNV